MKKQIITEEELQGKTIENSFTYQNSFYLIFKDNTFAMFAVYDTLEGFGHSTSEVILTTYSIDLTHEIYITYGIITQDECEKAVEEDRIQYEEYLEKKKSEELERERKHELELLQKLKEKYKTD